MPVHPVVLCHLSPHPILTKQLSYEVALRCGGAGLEVSPVDLTVYLSIPITDLVTGVKEVVTALELLLGLPQLLLHVPVEPLDLILLLEDHLLGLLGKHALGHLLRLHFQILLVLRRQLFLDSLSLSGHLLLRLLELALHVFGVRVEVVLLLRQLFL